MIDPLAFAHRQMELTAEFARYIVDNPDIDSSLPEDSYIYFEVDGEDEFNDYSRELAQREIYNGQCAVCVHVRGLAPPQGSRLIDPTITAMPHPA